ncbi:Uncharacterised protein [Streptococcus suis]|uniref:Secreted protein n=1 Tax=Streptococcus suis TaxID=1307 RepID=A0A123TEP2_STRSU|nr:Uncharacterised protein [Streptococcus suis]CYV20690.1 Uncharacterised protein [Streptococcus suis]CYV79524.1 Uncharacterised protein [Streptococcus suis]CYV86553.1 Uncharacterised protein [Streptococcus suis]
MLPSTAFLTASFSSFVNLAGSVTFTGLATDGVKRSDIVAFGMRTEPASVEGTSPFLEITETAVPLSISETEIVIVPSGLTTGIEPSGANHLPSSPLVMLTVIGCALSFGVKVMSMLVAPSAGGMISTLPLLSTDTVGTAGATGVSGVTAVEVDGT